MTLEDFKRRIDGLRQANNDFDGMHTLCTEAIAQRNALQVRIEKIEANQRCDQCDGRGRYLQRNEPHDSDVVVACDSCGAGIEIARLDKEASTVEQDTRDKHALLAKTWKEPQVVYIVSADGHEHSHVIGVFNNEEAATKCEEAEQARIEADWAERYGPGADYADEEMMDSGPHDWTGQWHTEVESKFKPREEKT
jgi:hypothetical protein